jgi:endonuclease/exonuclease/phosphatase family metal-dependent hydrolase
VAGHPGRVVRVVTWNLFHGRAKPAAGRSLREEFEAALRELEWDVALLQEAPPRWFRDNEAGVLTARNQLACLRGFLAERWPDAMKSNEGGSNQILANAPVTDIRTHTLARWPERRRLIFGRVEGLCVGNLHASQTGDHSRAAREVLRAAELCVGWAGGAPLVLGGDFNLRPREHPWAFEELEARFGLAPPTADDAVDHLLVRGAEIVERPHQLPPVTRSGVRLSDHAVVAASLRVA